MAEAGAYILPGASEELRIRSVVLRGNLDQVSAASSFAVGADARREHTAADAPAMQRLAQDPVVDATGRLTIVAALLGVVERVALLAVVFAGRSLLRLLAHLLLAVALEVDLVHGLGAGLRKCYAVGRICVSPRRVWMAITVPRSRDGAARDARHPMAAQCRGVGVL